MTPEDYLQHYCAPLRDIPVLKVAEYPALIRLDADKYYPPHAPHEPSIDMLQRSALLELLQDMLSIAYPQQRPSSALAAHLPKMLQELMDERQLHQQDMEVLRHRLAQSEADLYTSEVELHNYREQARLLNAEIDKLYCSNSWRCTKVLRWLGRVFSAIRSADIRIKFD